MKSDVDWLASPEREGRGAGSRGLDASARYVDRIPNQNVPGNTVCDARLAWQPTKTAEFAVVGQGIFDSRHPEFGMPRTRREVGRSIYGKLSCWF